MCMTPRGHERAMKSLLSNCLLRPVITTDGHLKRDSQVMMKAWATVSDVISGINVALGQCMDLSQQVRIWWQPQEDRRGPIRSKCPIETDIRRAERLETSYSKLENFSPLTPNARLGPNIDVCIEA